MQEAWGSKHTASVIQHCLHAAARSVSWVGCDATVTYNSSPPQFHIKNCYIHIPQTCTAPFTPPSSYRRQNRQFSQPKPISTSPSSTTTLQMIPKNQRPPNCKIWHPPADIMCGQWCTKLFWNLHTELSILWSGENMGKISTEDNCPEF